MLYVTSCGSMRKRKCLMKTSRLNGRNDYHILYCCEGTINLKIQESEYKLKRGDMAFISYCTPHEYFCNKNELISYYWIHFKGSRSTDLLNDLNFDNSFVLTADFDEKISNLFEQMLLTLYEQRNMYFKRCSALLVYILLSFYDKASEAGCVPHKEFTNFDKVISIMRAENGFEKSVGEFAEICHLSKSKFIKKFKEHTGYTPIAYRNIIIIDKAKWHLKNTDLTISEISDMLGFLNSSYFSTLFKTLTNLTPSEYRKKFNL